MKKIKLKLFILLLLIGTSIFGYNSIQEDNLVNKIPSQYRNHINEAMTCFPKGTFNDIRINFIEMNSDNMTWATRPSITSLLRSREKRTYLIQKSTHSDMDFIFKELSYDAQVGIFVHELCHILSYEKMTKFEIISFGYNYQYDEMFKKNKEQETDSLTNHYASKYWREWKLSECLIPDEQKSPALKKYWQKQHKYYLTIPCSK